MMPDVYLSRIRNGNYDKSNVKQFGKLARSFYGQ